MKKVSLAVRVMALLQGGDNAKVVRFESKLQKYFDKQIKMREDQKETLLDKIADATEAAQEAVVNINLSRINETDGAESYCSVYVSTVNSKLSIVDELQAEIDSLDAEIDQFKKVQDFIYSVETPESNG